MEDYYNIRASGSYGTINALHRLMQAKGERLTQKQVTDWLAEQEAFSLHKLVRRRFARRRTFSRSIDYFWQVDLVDIAHLDEHNNDFCYLSTIIDVFSKYACVVALKKDFKSVEEACGKFIEEEKRKPLKLQSDKSKEFVNGQFSAMLEDWDIQFYVSQ